MTAAQMAVPTGIDQKRKRRISTVRLFSLRTFLETAELCGAMPFLNQFGEAARQPAARASASEQNQRSPRDVSIFTRLYQGLHGVW